MSCQGQRKLCMTAAALKAWKHKHCECSPSTCWAAWSLPIWSRPRQAFHQASLDVCRFHDCMVALSFRWDHYFGDCMAQAPIHMLGSLVSPHMV